MKSKKVMKSNDDAPLTEVKRKAVAEQKKQVKATIKKLERQLKEVEAGATATADSVSKRPVEEQELLKQI